MTNSIKFFWNGIRVNGEKSLNKCSYSLDNHREYKECVSIYADRYGSVLPRDLFEVHNETDSYTDYFDSDHATLTPDHPLYKYARYAAVKYEIHYLKAAIKRMEKNLETDAYYSRNGHYAAELNDKMKRLAALEAIEDPGNPTDEDLAKIREMRLEAENARLAAEHEAELKAREERIKAENEGKAFIEKIASEHPIKEGEPVVTICWSENPAFYSWDDNELKLSVAAAEIILTHFDKEVHAAGDRGYDKTKFIIEYVNEDGERDTYEGCYDLGDDDGGMIEHIRAFGEWYLKKGHYGNGHPSDEDRETGKEIVKFADMLEGYTARGKIISVALAPWVEEVIKAQEKAQEKEVAFLMSTIKQMSDEDLGAAVMAIDPEDREREDVAEFFIKQLAMRDIKKAMEVYQAWKNR